MFLKPGFLRFVTTQGGEGGSGGSENKHAERKNKNKTPDHQAKMVEEKEKEGDELRASIAESNEESEANIQMKRRQTQNNIKVNDNGNQ